MEEHKEQKLRQIAEGKLDWTKINTIQDEDLKKAIHELNVHQIELELQNEELLNTQKSLEQTRDEFQYLYDFAPVGYCTLDKEGTIINMNLTFASMMEISRKESLQIPFYNLIENDEKDSFYLHLRTIFSEDNAGKKKSLTLNLKKQNGENPCVQLESMLGKDKTHVFTAIIDITEKKRIEDALHETEKQKSLVLNATKELFGYYDTDLEIQWLNKAALDSINKTSEEVQGRHCYELWTGSSDPCPDCPVLKALETGKPEEIEKQTPDGRYWLVRGYPIFDETGKTSNLCELTMDITAQKNAEHELRRMHKQLEKTNQHLEELVKQRTEALEKSIQLKDDFINQLGHDLKNPLGPLLNLLPVAEKNEKDPKQKEILNVINRNVKYMKSLVNKTIQLAQLRSPNTTVKYEHFNLKNEVTEILETNKMMFKERHITIQNDLPDDLYINADKLKIDEVFNNLLNNAVKYTDTDSGIININQAKDDDCVTISITDSGIGMSKEEIPHIFDEFYKADSSRHDFDSSGLGMTICKRIIEMHGGRIWAESEGAGKGSTFYFTLPKSNK